jgi:hypothetical protein
MNISTILKPTIVVCIFSFIMLGATPSVDAVPVRKAVQEAIEFAAKRFGRDVTKYGSKTLTADLVRQSAKYGDEVIVVFRKLGPESLKWIDNAGALGDDAVRLLSKHGTDGRWILQQPLGLTNFAKYGDDYVRVMAKHPGVAGPLVKQFGKKSLPALKKLSPSGARRLGLIATEPAFLKMGKTSALLDCVAKFGDDAAEFIWKNKGALAVSAVLTAFLVNPEPFIQGIANLGDAASDAVSDIADKAADDIAPLIAESIKIMGIMGLCFLMIIKLPWLVGKVWLEIKKVNRKLKADRGHDDLPASQCASSISVASIEQPDTGSGTIKGTQ